MGVDVQGLVVSIGGIPVVRGASLHLGDRERVGLVGSSGSGKSMIAKALTGLLPVQAEVSGSIALNGRQIVGADDTVMADLRGRSVGVIFQNPATSLNPVLTAVQQVMLPLRLHYDLSKAEVSRRAMDMLRKVGIDDAMARRYPHELSGGQQQRIGIATALVTAPRLIIADEPTTALDSLIQRQIVELLVSLVDDAGASMLFITHDFAVLAKAATRCYVLDEGAVVESGSIGALLDTPQSAPGRRLVDAAKQLTLDVGGA